MAKTLLTQPKYTVYYQGAPATGAKIYVYLTGTATPATTYSNYTGTANAHPIVCDSRGECDVWVNNNDGQLYDITVKTSADVTIYTAEKISGVQNITSDLVVFTPAGAGAVATNVQAKLRESVSVLDYGADPTGATDSRSAIQAAVAAVITASGGGTVYFPKGIYLVNSVASSDTSPNGILIPYVAEDGDYNYGVTLLGEGPDSEIRAGSSNMVLVRVSRNQTTLEKLRINCVAEANGCIGVGAVPESMTSTTVLADQSRLTMRDVTIEHCTEALKFQPGPQVGGSDSGAYYNCVYNCVFNWNTRAVWTAKNSDWATYPNRVTRTIFVGCKTTRGNCGYYFEVGSEIELHGCFEELINTGTSPCSTPTARYISADADSIEFFGGYSEACDRPVDTLARATHRSFGYSASTAFPANWYTNMEAFGDVLSPATWTPVVVSSGGGAQGVSTSTGYHYRSGSLWTFCCEINVDKGTLNAGTLSISGLPLIALAAAGTQGATVSSYSQITFSANYHDMACFVTGGTITLRKTSQTGTATAGLTLAECNATIQILIQGSIIV